MAAAKDTKKEKKKVRTLSSLYSISGNKIERKNRFCPKCGPGFFMGNHLNRVSCGNCGFTEFRKK
ncbi:MAG TPA: 30S ribosomal protein S27ae [Candidatus Nanoarchaeia archaeon]|nr:30S ribosomal protein S27ae [Candidatus Nanoarchaeia archaeon]